METWFGWKDSLARRFEQAPNATSKGQDRLSAAAWLVFLGPV